VKLPLSWLEEWASVPWAAEELARRLTFAGFEVEGSEVAAPPFTGVVVARIVSAEPHPQADKLKVCRVESGAGDAVQIVCGAANARAGLTVALAQVGAMLPGDVRIKAAKLRGVESSGMLCSAKELGLAAQSDGLLELPGDAPVGAGLRDWLRLDDPIIELKVYPNRGDALSVRGLAREVVALTGGALQGPRFAVAPVTTSHVHPVVVDAPNAAPRFLTRVVTGVDNRRHSPQWLTERLRRCGLRSISPVVDVTNYVMLELGQPLHAYDRRLLSGAMHVRMARAGEPLELLDGRQLELGDDVLVIADAERAIGLAGIMGGNGTAITEDVTDVLLEVAYFAPDAIAGRARRHGLQTDASQRFERGVDPEGQRHAMERATALLLELCGGQAGPVGEAVEPASLPPRPPVLLRRGRLRQLVGGELPAPSVEAAFRALQFGVETLPEGWRVTPPSWRFDLTIEADLAEEAMRIIGYDQVPEEPKPLPQRIGRRPEAEIVERVVLDALVGRGFQEVLNYTFVDPALQERLFPGVRGIRLANPIAADQSVMRVSLWPGLLRNALENQRRQQDRVRVFELGSVFLGERGTVREPRQVAGLALGRRLPEQWGAPADPADFFDLKADVEAVLALSGDPAAFGFEAATLPCLHPGRSARVLRDGTPIGWIGELHPELVRALDCGSAPLLFELDLAQATLRGLPKVAAPSRFPQVRRDLAVTVPAGLPLSRIKDRVSVAAGSLLRELRVFDLYQGPGIESGRKSIAFGLIFQDNDKTLKDEDADRLMAAVAADLKANLDARLRD
jgi:phenylalanyl-tRNA synthetase beta chain